jgi:predicted nucleotidyltransferase
LFLHDLTEALVQAVRPRQVLLFGSYARGEATRDSDIDLLVVEDEPFGASRSRRGELRRIRRALSRFRVPKDILLYSRDEVRQWRPALNHVIGRAYREGVVLYGSD